MLETWSNKLFLKFNPSKTKVVYFSRKACHIAPTLFFQGWSVFLFIAIQVYNCQTNLSWSEYIFSILEKAKKKIKTFEKIEVQN